MIKNLRFAHLFSAAVLWLAACATVGDTDLPSDDRQREAAVDGLHAATGAPVTVEVNEAGTTRVVAMTPRFPASTAKADPASAAAAFLADHHDAFQLAKDEVPSFVVSSVDVEPKLGVSHVTLQRVYNGIPVFQGALQIQLDLGNNVIRATADDTFHIAAPRNRLALTASEAAVAAGKRFGLRLALPAGQVAGLATTFEVASLLDPVKVEPRIFQVAPGDDRFAYQVLLSWKDASQGQQYQLALVDAQTGDLLYDASLVNTFTGRVYSAASQLGVTNADDARTVVSFDGDPTASPSGWVDATRKTQGNNAVAATDLNGNNQVGTNEVQPTANASDSFDFAFNANTDAAAFREAAVTNAFFYVNDFHDRTYALGWTEASRNFQLDNFGRGGVAADPVNVDAQDGSGTNNANFATPPDGTRPRMQMFLFNIRSGSTNRQDGDVDGTVVYHENAHGLSNRLVGGGSTTCLTGLQSGGMGEGWSDFMAATFLGNPVIGAYVTGDGVNGIRSAPMSNSPYTYGSIKDGTLGEVHDVGELWAATLWDLRTALGKELTEQLVVQGMKNTPCSPTMLGARDGILSADATLNAGANVCAIWTVFAARKMGATASSPNHNSTSTIVTSSQLPVECGGTPPPTGPVRDYVSTDVPKTIPDNNATGVRSNVVVSSTATDILKVTVDVNIKHTWRGDLVVQLLSPSGQVATLSNREGGSADDFIVSGFEIADTFTGNPNGTWQLFVRDLAGADVGTINAFTLHVMSTN